MRKAKEKSDPLEEAIKTFILVVFIIIAAYALAAIVGIV